MLENMIEMINALSEEPVVRPVEELIDALITPDPDPYKKLGTISTPVVIVPGSTTLICVTGKSGRFGALQITKPLVKTMLTELFGGPFFVLPSSVHEVLCIRDDGVFTPEELAEMVRTVNDSPVLDEKDRLCDNVFRYEPDIDQFSIAG